MSDPTSTMALFRNQTIRALWFAALSSNFGRLAQAVGVLADNFDRRTMMLVAQSFMLVLRSRRCQAG